VARQKTTINDIARALNITASTVSRALNQHPSISEATRQAVHEKAKDLNYKPNQLAAALRSGRSHTVGVVVSAADRSFFGKVIRGIEDEVAPAGYNVVVTQTHDEYEREKQVLETLIRSQVDGVIASLGKYSPSHDHYRRLVEGGMPLVLFDNTDEDLGVSQVVIDDFEGAYMAVKHLIEQGCRRIAHFAGPQHLPIYAQRLSAYQTALADHDLPFASELVVDCPSEVSSGLESIQKLWSLSQRPDGLFSSSDYAALGAIKWLKDQGVVMPDQLCIVGFSNEPFTSFIDPALSTVDQHSRRMGRRAARLLLEEIKIDKPKPSRTILKPELIIRASSQVRNRKKSPPAPTYS
jgi:LacI family transcriptional regulator